MTEKSFEAGERILLEEVGDRRTFMVELKPGRTFNTHSGVIKHDDIIGRQEGAEILTHLRAPYIAVRPTLVQRMMKVKRKTQIIYPKEAARIVIELGIAPGTRVIEIGSGSGSLTLLLATLVRPSGRVYSFDRNPEFQQNAQENVARAELSEWVTFATLDAGASFGVTDVDAIVLDLPEPWLAIQPAMDALRLGGMLASIIPNAEQLKQLHISAEDAGFKDLRVIEILEREILVRRREGVRPADRMIGFTAYLLFGRKW